MFSKVRGTFKGRMELTIAPVVKLLASLSSFIIRCTHGNSMGVMHDVMPSIKYAAKCKPSGISQTRRVAWQKSRTVAAKVKGTQIG